MKLTRRGWVAFAAAAPVLAQVTTPTTPQAATPVAAPPPDNPALDVRKVSDRLAQTEVPMPVEPSFTFRA